MFRQGWEDVGIVLDLSHSLGFLSLGHLFQNLLQTCRLTMALQGRGMPQIQGPRAVGARAVCVPSVGATSQEVWVQKGGVCGAGLPRM